MPLRNGPRAISHGRRWLCAASVAMEKSALVIVESPAKAATIQRMLPADRFRVRSCVGHVRELPSSAKRIPAKYKGEAWARLGVDVEHDFKPLYVLIAGKQKIINELKKELGKAGELILATDEDREGEAISWHLMQLLKPAVPVKRAVFHEITPEAIGLAFENCRQIDLNVVQAQETRRVLDRLAGYTMSPLLWKKISRGLSAGRVQSVAMSVIVQVEMARLRFVPAQYWDCTAVFTPQDRIGFQATLAAIDGVRLARGTDFDAENGQLLPLAASKGIWCLDEPGVHALLSRLRLDVAKVESVDRRRVNRNPPAPLITSTLQQECGNKLGMGVGRTMRAAQKLYENGLITYMRTDNPSLSEQALGATRTAIENLYGVAMLADNKACAARAASAKPKSAQAAHEAIRPAGTSFVSPSDTSLEGDELAVYRLIYRRTLASHMVSAKLDTTAVKITVPLSPVDDAQLGTVATFRASGSIIVEPGFLRSYSFGDDAKGSSSFLPDLSEGEPLGASNTTAVRHETKPPARFNDASLVKELEELGVGRPSTYATIIEKLIERGYVYRGSMLGEGKAVPSRAMVPSLTAFAVDSLLSTHFPSFIDPKFTARMEEALDEIASGSADRTHYLKEYYCGEQGLAASVERTEQAIDPTAFRRICLPNMPKEMFSSPTSPTRKAKTSTKRSKKATSSTSGKANSKLSTKTLSSGSEIAFDWSNTRVLVGPWGPYLEQDGVALASLPRATLAEDLSAANLQNVLQLAKDPVLGAHPETGEMILVKASRWGPYVQLGQDEDMPEGTKPKRSGLLPGMDVSDLTVDLAAQLLSLPRLLGLHPKSGEEVRAGVGPYGSYVVHNGSFVSLRKDASSVLTVELEEAIALISSSEERKRLRLEKKAMKNEKIQLQ